MESGKRPRPELSGNQEAQPGEENILSVLLSDRTLGEIWPEGRGELSVVRNPTIGLGLEQTELRGPRGPRSILSLEISSWLALPPVKIIFKNFQF